MEHAFAQPLTTSAPPRRAALAVLDAVQIANPCPAEWEAMGAVDGQARDRVRHCGECNLRVYNLSAMKRHDAQELLRASEGRLCVRLYRRQDGTVLTQDCSWYRRIVDKSADGARRVAWLAACGLAALLGSAVWAGSLLREDTGGQGEVGAIHRGFAALTQCRPIDSLVNWLNPQRTVAVGKMGSPAGTWVAGGAMPVLMGDVAQGEFVPSDPMPRTPPEQWLAADEPAAAPL